MFIAPVEKLFGHHGKPGHYAPSSSRAGSTGVSQWLLNLEKWAQPLGDWNFQGAF